MIIDVFKAIALILLAALIFKKGITGCFSFILGAIFIMIAGYTLFQETGIILGILGSLGLVVKQLRS
jgi:hypothetical protein